MLKGITNVEYCQESIPFTAFESVIVTSVSTQDTSKTLPNTMSHRTLEKSSTGLTRSTVQIYQDSASKKSAQDKVVHAQLYTTYPIVKLKSKDTSSVKIHHQINPVEHKRNDQDELYGNNFLLAIPHKNLSQNFDTTLLKSKPKQDTVPAQNHITVSSAVVLEKNGFEGKPRNVSIDWLPGILLISLFTFSWMKLLYQKYLVQVITSTVNYNVSQRLFRERNVLFRNMALGLNLVFAVNTGLFIFFILSYFNIDQVSQKPLNNILLYSFAVTLLYNIKTFFCKMLGNIFMVKEEFSEYVHNINLYNKNIGLFLFPVVILFPYVNDNIKPFIIYLGILTITSMFLLRIYRGLQIIMRKGVSTFYLILYLCAVEILPVLVLIKYSITLI
jgi:hypothetical protein